MPRVPAEQRLRFRERRQVLRIDQSLHRDRAQIGDFQIIARFERLNGLRVETETEARYIADQSKEHTVAHGAEPMRFGRREQRLVLLAIGFHDDVFAADHIDNGAVLRGKFRHRVSVAAQHRGAVERIFNVAQPGWRAEIGAGGHDY